MAFAKLSLDVFLLIAEVLGDFDLNALSRTNRQIHNVADHLLYARDSQRDLVMSVRWAFQWDNERTLEKVVRTRINNQEAIKEAKGAGKEVLELFLQPLIPTGWTILTFSAKQGLRNIVTLLLDYGFDVNDSTDRGHSALHVAVSNGQDEISMALLDSTQQHSDTLPVFVAALKGHWHLVEAMIRRGFKVNREEGEISLLELAIRHREEGRVALLLEHGINADYRNSGSRRSTPLMHAAAKGQVTAVKLLIQNGACINSRDSFGSTPLMHAVAKGQVVAVKLLIKKGACINSRDSSGSTPLLEAVSQGHNGIIEVLLQNGADAMSRDKRGYTPILLASRLGKNSVIQRLLQARETNLKLCDTDSLALLMFAIAKGQLEALSLVLGRGADVNSRDSFGSTPLLKAAIQEHVGVVEMLLSHGANVMSQDKYGNTPLLLAAEHGKVHVVCRLLEARDIDLEFHDIQGRTSLLKAVAMGHVSVVDTLLNHGANANSRDKNGDTPLLLAAGHGNIPMVRRLLRARDINLESCDRNGRTPLLRAACQSEDILIDLLIKSNADTTRIDKLGHTALSLAISNPMAREATRFLLQKSSKPGVFLRQGARVGHFQTVDYILKTGLPPDEAGLNGRTALSWAAFQGNEKVVELLLNTGAVNVDSKDHQGRTPLILAAERNHGRVIRALVRAGADMSLEDDAGRTARWWQRALNSRPTRGLPRLSRPRKRKTRSE